jgi:uncharacterized protein (DUF342 family)
VTHGQRKNGFLELKFNDDRTQALATIYPPSPDGEPVQAIEVIDRLKNMGVTYGIREAEILEAIHQVSNTRATLIVVAAQGTLPEQGQDAKIRYRLPLETLSRPLPKNEHGFPDWFALEPAKMVRADDDLAVIVPPNGGAPGKTLTWPPKDIPPKAGKPAALVAGPHVRIAEDSLRMSADADGYVVLQHEKLTVYALRQIQDPVMGGTHLFAAGAVFTGTVKSAQITAGEFLAIKGATQGCRIRCHGDVYLTSAEQCAIVAAGDVYVSVGLRDCEITTPRRVIMVADAGIVGGKVCALEGIEAVILGAEDFTATELTAGVDRYSRIRIAELEEELAGCEANIMRIRQALKPFATLAAHTALPEDKRQLLQKLQTQKRTQEARITALQLERHEMLLGIKGRRPGTITVLKTAYPGVWISINNAAMQVESPLEQVQFVEGAGGRSVELRPLQEAA